jgi:hypothetical protein
MKVCVERIGMSIFDVVDDYICSFTLVTFDTRRLGFAYACESFELLKATILMPIGIALWKEHAYDAMSKNRAAHLI